MELKPERHKMRKLLIKKEKRIDKGTDRALQYKQESWFLGKLVTPMPHRAISRITQMGQDILK